MRLKFFVFAIPFIGMILSCFITPLCAYSQVKKPMSASVLVKTRAQKDRILLRWAVNEPAAWRQANQYGYTVERYTVLRDGKINTVKDKKLLTLTPLKPKPQSEWADIIQKNDDAAVIAQGLFGENFEVNGGDSKLAKIVNQSDELNQRFTFSLLAADRNFEAAQMAGWGLVDSTVKAGEKYLYRIFTAVPKDRMKIDTGGVYIGTADYEPLPQPKDLYGVYGDKTVMLSWNYKLLKDIYTTYFIERSEDGQNFSKISDLPVANLNEKEDYTPSRMFYTDTLQDNNKKYFYRIKGLTAFGEISTPSEAVSGEGKQVLAFVPNIKNADILNDSTAKIEWEFATEGTSQIDHFELDRSVSADKGSYKTVLKNITPSERSTVNRDTAELSLPPVKALDAMTWYLQMTESNPAGSILSTRMPHRYYLGYYYKTDFSDLQYKVVNRYVNNPGGVPEHLYRFITSNFPLMKSGKYKVQYRYILPGNIQGSVQEFEFENPVQ